MNHAVLAVPLAAGCLLAPALLPSQQSPDELFPTPAQGLVLPAGSESAYTVADLIADFARVTGETVLMSAETRNLVRAQPLALDGGTQEVQVAPERVYSYFESLLIASDFALVPLTRAEPRTMVVRSLVQGGPRSPFKNQTIRVPAEDLETYADHPAIPITTALTLPNVDVRQLTTSLRPLMPDQQTQSMLNAGSSHSVILTGFGSTVADLARMLREIDRLAGEAARAEERGERGPADVLRVRRVEVVNDAGATVAVLGSERGHGRLEVAYENGETLLTAGANAAGQGGLFLGTVDGDLAPVRVRD